MNSIVIQSLQTIRYAWRMVRAHPGALALNVLLLTLGLASVTFLLLVNAQVQRAFERDLAGIDLVVGAKGSALQLILAGVLHVDVASGNIALADVQALAKNPAVKKLIPLSLGDSVRGYRIVGTSLDYPAHYGVALASGQWWAQPEQNGQTQQAGLTMQAVLGADVARAMGLGLGAQFAGSHGMAGGGAAHAFAPFTVVGTMQSCACVLDRLVLTATESVWQMHETAHGKEVPAVTPTVAVTQSQIKNPTKTEHDEDDHQDHEDHDKDAHDATDKKREVTLALIQYASPLAAVSFPRFVNTTTAMQAAAPAVEITRLLRMLGVGTQVIQGFAAVLLAVAALSLLIALWNALRERRADLAMLRMLGASPAKIVGLLLTETLLLAALATVLGLILGHCLTALVGYWLVQDRSLPISGWVWLADEWWIPALAVALAVLASLLPAISAYRMDVLKLLQSR